MVFAVLTDGIHVSTESPNVYKVFLTEVVVLSSFVIQDVDLKLKLFHL